METETTQTDSVVSLMAWFEVHKKRIAIVTGIGLAAILVAMILIQRQAENELSASAALSDVRLPFSSATVVPAGTADQLAKVAADHKGTQAAARALLLSAGVLFSEADYAGAEKRFAQVTLDYPDSLWNAQAALGLAGCLKAQGKNAEATAKYEDITKRFASSPVIGEAKLSLARLYEKSNATNAFMLYQELMKENPNSVLTMEASMRQDDLADSNEDVKKLKETQMAAALAQAQAQAMSANPAMNQQVKITPMTNSVTTNAARIVNVTNTAGKPVEIKLTPTPGAANTPPAK